MVAKTLARSPEASKLSEQGIPRVSTDAVGEAPGEGLQAVAGVDFDARMLLGGFQRASHSASNTAMTSNAKPGRHFESARSPRPKTPCSE